MDQIEIILRTTTPSGKVTEQLLARFDTEKPATASCLSLQSARKSVHKGADLSGSLEGGAGGC